MPHYAYVNGRYVPHRGARVHIEDRGFQFADGIYEVISCINGHLADERGHIDRLERSLKELKMGMPVPRNVLQAVMRELLRKNRLKNAAIYIQVTRGAARRDFKFPKAGSVKQSLILTAWPFDFASVALKPIKVITVPDIRWKRRDIKTVGLLAQSMAKQAAAEKGAQEAWMIDDDGYVTEGASSNAWILRGNILKTRPAGHDILKGVTRSALQKLAQQLQIRIVEEAFTPKEACEADEAFNTAATALVSPVVEIDGHIVGDGKPGKIATKLYEEYRRYVENAGEHVAWTA